MKRFMIGTILVLGSVYLIALAALYILQRSVLYIPPKVYLTPAGVDLSSAVEVPAPNEPNNIMGWWIPPKEEGAPTVLYFHGNGSAVYSANDVYRTLHDKGYGVFALAYPGYPGRAGQTTQQSLTKAAIEGYDYVTTQGVAPDTLAFYGTSLGAGVAAQLSIHRKPALIIMEAPFTSAADMAQLTFPLFPAALLTKDKFDSRKALASSAAPMVWIHGTHDNVIPLSVGQALHDSYDGPKSAHVIPNGQHNNLWHLGGEDIILSALAKIDGASSSSH